MNALLAALPLLLILLLMLGARWSAARAGLVGVGLALVVAVGRFGYGTIVFPELGRTRAVAGASLEAAFTAGTVLWIVFPALCIYQLQRHTGAIDVLRAAVGAVSADPRIVVLLVAWFFALFLEGAAGFGTPVALAAPFLVNAGFGRVQAVSMAMIGHAAGVSFGAVGTPVMVQAVATGLSTQDIARATGVFHALLAWVMLIFLARLMQHAKTAPESDGVTASLPWGWIATAGACFLIPFAWLAFTVGPELPTLGGALAGGLLFVLLLRWRSERVAPDVARRASTDRSVTAAGDAVSLVPLLRAASPYLALVALILVTRLVEPLRTGLDGIRWSWHVWNAFSGSVSPLYHPGTLLMAGFLIGAALQRVPRRALGMAASAAFRQLGMVAVALIAMLMLSRLLVRAGMVDVLATSAASVLGETWPVFAPLAGVLGTFVTGSATSSNILFTDFQRATAEALGLPVLTMTAAQGFGAAVGNIICPHNIIAGGATVGLDGREGEVLRRTLVPCLVYALLGGALAMGLVARG